MAGVSIKVSGLEVAIGNRAREAARGKSLLRPNQLFGQRLRRGAINRLNDRKLKYPRVTTNTLGRSIQVINDARKGRVFTNLAYARVQQEGDPNHRPSKRKFLAIPNPTNMSLRRSKKWPSDFPADTFTLIKSKGGNPLLIWAQKLGKGGRKRGTFGSKVGEVAYILRRKVVIPRRRFLLATTDDLQFYAEQIRNHVLGIGE